MFGYLKLKRIHHYRCFPENFLEFFRTAILILPGDRLEQKTVTTAFPDNLRSSHPEVFSKIVALKRF